jgi:hypothetical protein
MRKRQEGTTSLARSALLVRVVFINSFATIAVLAVLAMVWGVPLVFPSLGPTAFLLFASPELPSACPRNALCGHAIGILCGYGALWLTGLQHAPSAMLEGVNLARVAAAAVLACIHRCANDFVRSRAFSGRCDDFDRIPRNHHRPSASAGHRSGGRAHRRPGNCGASVARYRLSTLVPAAGEVAPLTLIKSPAKFANERRDLWFGGKHSNRFEYD